jgi:hypothetical protein
VLAVYDAILYAIHAHKTIRGASPFPEGLATKDAIGMHIELVNVEVVFLDEGYNQVDYLVMEFIESLMEFRVSVFLVLKNGLPILTRANPMLGLIVIFGELFEQFVVFIYQFYHGFLVLPI